MSQTDKYEDKVLSLLGKIADQTAPKQSPPPPSPPATESSKPTHQTHSKSVVFDCPECQKLYDEEVAAKAVTEFKKQVKSMKSPTLCEGDNCGEIYDAEEQDNCPTCHTHK